MATLNTKSWRLKKYFAKTFQRRIMLGVKRVATGFKERVVRLQQVAGSQRKLAVLIGVSPPTITGWAEGSEPFYSTFERIAERTGIDVEWLARGVGDEEAELAAFAERLKKRAKSSIDGPRAKLRAAREKAGLSYKDLGKQVGRDAAFLRALEEEGAPISDTTIDLITGVLPSLTKEDLSDGSDSPRIVSEDGTVGTYGAKPQLTLPPGVKGRYVPLLSLAEAGPLSSGHTDGFYDYTAVFAPNVDDRKAFAIKVSGNSMEPQLREDDMVICSPGAELHNGDAAVVRTRSDQVFIKYWQKRGAHVFLESANPAYKAIEFPLAEIAGAWPIIQHISSGKITKQL